MRNLRHIGTWYATGLAGMLMVGCAANPRPQDVPSAAMSKTEGDQRLVYTASDPGTVWVTEGASDILYSGPVAAGDRLVVDPDTGKLLLNDRVVLDKDVNHVDHNVFFLPGAAPPPPEAVAASDRPTPRPAGVPMTALVGGEGKARVEYTAQRDGFIWITDEDQQRVLYSGPVNRGDIIVVDPQKNLMTINSQSVYKETVAADNHRIFFSSERPVWRSADETPGIDSSARPADVPADATRRAEGFDRIDFVAARDGTVWVCDLTTGRTIYSGRILMNDRLTLDPGANLLTLNSRPVHTPDLVHDRYAVYFSQR